MTYSASSGDLAVERVLVGLAAAVAVELDVRQMAARVAERLHRLERRPPVAGHAEIVAVDVDRVRQPQLVDGARDLFDDLPRRDAEVRDVLVQAVHVAARQLLPDLDAAGIDDLRREAFGRSQQPGDERSQPLRLVALDRLHDVVVVAHEDEEPLVDAGRVVELFVDVPRGQRRDRGVEGRGVAHAGVLVAGGKRAGDAAHRSAARARRADDLFGLALLLGPHLAGGVHLGPGDVTVHVHAAGHDDQTGGVERPVRPDIGIRRRVDDLSVTNPDIAALAVDAVNRVVDGAPRNLEEPAAHDDAGIVLATASARSPDAGSRTARRSRSDAATETRDGEKSGRRPCGRPCRAC